MFKPLVGALALSATLGATLFAAPAGAEDLHDGDIVISVSGGKLVATGGHLDLGLYFEGDFGDLAGGLYKTDDPGYDSAAGTFASGTQVSYMALGSLMFWSGSHWSAAAVPSGVKVKVDGNLGEETFWAAAGVEGDPMGLIGQAGASGNIHEHLDMSVTGDNRSTIGAYLIAMKLVSSSTALQASNPYYIALNRGLDDEAFERAVGALAPIPEPSTWALSLFGLAAVGWAARRRAAR